MATNDDNSQTGDYMEPNNNCKSKYRETFKIRFLFQNVDFVLCILKTKKYRNCIEGEYVAAIGDCTSYFVCSYGYFVRQFCSAGLAWNDQKKMCDWKYNVYCNYQRSNSIFTFTSKNTKNYNCISFMATE